MPQRKITPTGGKKNRKPERFTLTDIVRAIEGVEAAGLKIYSVEITLTGAINIVTQRPTRQAQTDTQNSATPPSETKPIKKQA